MWLLVLLDMMIYWAYVIKKGPFLLGIQTEILIVKIIIIYLEFALNIPEKKMK